MTHAGNKMTLKLVLRRTFYSFPVQLLIMMGKKNHLTLLYWLILFGFVTGSFFNRFGVPLLFLDPEYVGGVGFISFFIVGIAVGGFIMAFNISSYILNSFRFPFLATLSRTFLKFSLNNFIIPGIFLVVYIWCIIDFQFYNQLKTPAQVSTSVLGLLLGVAFIMFITFRYFLITNKDIYKLYGLKPIDHVKDAPVLAHLPEQKKRKSAELKKWRVETYLSFPFRVKLVRSTRHYKNYMLQRVFRQNHVNAAIVEIIVFVTFIGLGLFRDFKYAQIPAAASILLLVTMILMISGVLRYWLRGWAGAVIIFLFIALNYLSQFELFNQRNRAYGLKYDVPALYSQSTLEEAAGREKYEADVNTTLRVLENWKKKWNGKGVDKPKMILLNVSGGGTRSMLYTFRSMQMIDSVLNGALMEHTRLISGSSGGIIAVSYYRELYLSRRDSLLRANHDIHNIYLRNMGRDILNSIMFTATVGDVFLNVQRLKVDDEYYPKDRAYAFERQLNLNTRFVLDKRLSDYYEPEMKSEIPMLLISPVSVNDARFVVMSPLPVSYLISSPANTNGFDNVVTDGIEFSHFFKDQDAANAKYTSLLRMNATFPYIMPVTSLPSIPPIDVMDSGVGDNFGTDHSLKFLYTFRNWIAQNTSGVIFLQIRDTYKKARIEDNSIKTITEKIMAPFRSMTGNFLLMQDYRQDDTREFATAWFKGRLDFVTLSMPLMEDRISLSWHLTRREKNFILNQSLNESNRAALEKLKELLDVPENGLKSLQITEKR